MLTSHACGRYLSEGSRRGHFAPSTLITYRSILHRFVTDTGNPEVSRLTRQQVARWYGNLTCRPATTRHRLSVVQTFLEWCVQNGHMNRNPATGFRPPAQPRHLPRNMPTPDVMALMAAVPDARARLIVSLMAQEGLRCKEVAGLQVGDIDLLERSVRIVGKGDHERVVPLTDETEELLHAYLWAVPAIAGPLIRSYSDSTRALSAGYIGNRMALWMRAAGVKQRPYDGRSAHALRHTAATEMLRHGANVRSVQKVLGHESLATTQRYLGWNVEDLRAAVAGRSYRGLASGAV